MSYEVLISEQATNYLLNNTVKSKNIIKKNLVKLNNPYPGKGSGDKEKLIVSGQLIYRLHIGRTHTAFYIIDKSKKIVRVIEILSIEVAHKKYGF